MFILLDNNVKANIYEVCNELLYKYTVILKMYPEKHC